jgi:putative PIN family toxin of toxin-antitoxin system
MRVCIDTNVLVQLFGVQQPFRRILDALINGSIELALSNEILFEYEEIVVLLSGAARWQTTERFLNTISVLHDNVLYVQPSFRFGVIAVDADDNKFIDCGISAGADFIVTSDRHFDALLGLAYRPKPITPQEFIQKYL